MRKLLLTMTSVLLPVAAAGTFLACEGSGSSGGAGSSAGSTATTVTTDVPSTTVLPNATSTTVLPDDDTTYLCPEGGIEAVRELQSSVDSGHQPWRLSAEDVAVACTGGDGTASPEGTDRYRVTSDDGSAVLVDVAQPLGPGTIWVVTQVTPATPPEGASCDAGALLAATRAELPTDLEIVSVTVEQCQNGYARVHANPDQSGCGQPNGSCYENEQVFLADTGGEWTYMTSGTGISCSSDDDLSPALVTACEALGLR